jgi:hypothetical protein
VGLDRIFRGARRPVRFDTGVAEGGAEPNIQVDGIQRTMEGNILFRELPWLCI